MTPINKQVIHFHDVDGVVYHRMVYAIYAHLSEPIRDLVTAQIRDAVEYQVFWQADDDLEAGAT